MHLAGSNDVDFDTHIMPEMAARTSFFPPPAAKIHLGLIVLQEAHTSGFLEKPLPELAPVLNKWVVIKSA